MFPVEEKIGEIAHLLASGTDVVLTAPPGSGKTTCVPPALLGSSWLGGRKILMLEPRRMAARSCACCISGRLGGEVGATVGYSVRLERRVSAATKIEIVTEALLTQRLLEDPGLSDTGLVIFDEFHERSVHSDLAFAMTLEMKRLFRPDMRILVMSATLDADAVNSALKGAVVRAEGTMYPVETIYLGPVSAVSAIRKALCETQGDVLCFLPGEGEIRKCAEALGQTDGVRVMQLYGSLPKEEQDAVFEPSSARRVILSTSIAETSLTLPGIKCVIDSGLMRTAKFSPATGMSSLVTLPLPLDRAEQRRGRAGRVSSGICYRLWNESDERSRPKAMTPEILDADLCRLVVSCAAWGAPRRCDLPWLTAPPSAAWERAMSLLQTLGFVDDRGSLTAKGEKCASMPVHPRLANMLLSRSPRAAELAAVIEDAPPSRESDIRYVPVTGRLRRLSSMFLRGCHAVPTGESDGSLLARAYPDRIARNRGNGTFCMVSGRGAFISPDDPLSREEFLVCCRLDDRQGDAKIFLACPVDGDEIAGLYGEKMKEERFCRWDARSDRVKAVVRRKLGEMVYDEKPCADIDPSEAFVEEVRHRKVENIPAWNDHSLRLRARMEFAWKGSVGDEAVLAALPDFVKGMTKWRDLEKLDMEALLFSIAAGLGHSKYELDTFAPERIQVPTGSRIKVDYSGEAPKMEVRLQECFGMSSNPCVALGRVKVVMTLLSPAGRPCATTDDISRFWSEGYALVRKDLRGRYPKHYWPEDPACAVATARIRPKGDS